MPFDLKTILLSFLITIVAYGFFPLLFAKMRKKAITKGIYYLVCFIFNFFISLFFSIFNANSSGAPYIIWTTVFASLGIHLLNDKYVLVATRAQICPRCKSPLRPNKDYSLYCSSCGFTHQTTKQPVNIIPPHLKNNTNSKADSSWQCSCGRIHPKNETTCVCGKSKEYNKKTETDKICFCRKCGEKLIDGSNFCGKCGTKIIKE